MYIRLTICKYKTCLYIQAFINIIIHFCLIRGCSGSRLKTITRLGAPHLLHPRAGRRTLSHTSILQVVIATFSVTFTTLCTSSRLPELSVKQRSPLSDSQPQCSSVLFYTGARTFFKI